MAREDIKNRLLYDEQYQELKVLGSKDHKDLDKL
jgi:hypothetical protein